MQNYDPCREIVSSSTFREGHSIHKHEGAARTSKILSVALCVSHHIDTA